MDAFNIHWKNTRYLPHVSCWTCVVMTCAVFTVDSESEVGMYKRFAWGG